MLRCNACWSDLEGKSVVTSCQHLFCLKCAQQIVENDASCPVCDAIISKSTVKVINSLQDSASCQLLLCGQAPETALTSALASVQFFVSQQQLQAELREAQLTKKINKVQEACRKKLEEVHNGYVQAKRKYEEAMRVNQALKQDSEELQNKYAQKAQQARKLQELVKRVQQENESLRHGASKVAQPVSAGRTMSPTMAQPGHMVTTVQRTQVFANLPSPPNNGGYGAAIQQAVLPNSGRVQGITGGYRVQQGSASQGGNGGFLGGSMDANSPGSLLGSLSQGGKRAGSGTSFGGGGGAGMHHAGVAGGGGVPGAQDQSNNALRKMLGMPPAMGAPAAMLQRRNSMHNDLFSM